MKTASAISSLHLKRRQINENLISQNLFKMYLLKAAALPGEAYCLPKLKVNMLQIPRSFVAAYLHQCFIKDSRFFAFKLHILSCLWMNKSEYLCVKQLTADVKRPVSNRASISV